MPEKDEKREENGNGEAKKALALVTFIIKHWKSIAVLVGFLWAVYTEYTRYMETGKLARDMKEDYQIFKGQIVKDTVMYSHKFIRLDKAVDSLKKLGEELLEYKAKFDYLENRTKYDSIDLNLVYSAIRHILDDYIWNGIKFKRAKDGTLFYPKGSLLYNVAFDSGQNRYYYYAENGKTYWCE
jgi:hypothetical protein